MKLSKRLAAAHQKACNLLEKDSLTYDEKVFVFDNWHEGARHMNGVAGAFFTPDGLARDLAIESYGPTVIDLCAGIGRLAFAVSHHIDITRMVCVELNPDYVEVGRKVVPEATWIRRDVLDLPVDIGSFDCAISNPPFGRIAGSTGKGDKYSGSEFEYKVIEAASRVARYGVFIIPQQSAPFEYSGRQCYKATEPSKYAQFRKQTGIELTPNCGLDTSAYMKYWRGVSPAVEIVLADFAAMTREKVA